MAIEPKFEQELFHGGLNTNPKIEQVELQECTGLFLDEIGKAAPDFQDTLIKTVANIEAIGTADGYVYYNVANTLYRIKDGITDTLGTIGDGVFQVIKDGEIHLIRASDKMYKVIGSSLTALGTAGPTVGPTLALSSQLNREIEDFEDASLWTGSPNVVLGDDAVNPKIGTNSMKFSLMPANTIQYATKGHIIDLTKFDDDNDSDDDDMIALWVYLNTPGSFSRLEMIFDISTADFKNDQFSKIVPIIPQAFEEAFSDNTPETFTDRVRNIDWDQQFSLWNESFDANERTEFNKNYVGKNITNQLVQDKQTTKRVARDTGQPGWSKIQIRKNEFVRTGNDTSKGWDTVKAIKIIVVANAASLEMSIDDMRLIGGGKLDDERYRLSYSYVTKASLADGTAYEEESQLSPEIEIQGTERQNIVVTDIADSPDSQVTHKRVYIRGGGLQLRHLAGEIVTGITTLTTDDDEPTLVVQPIESSRKNGVPPTDPEYAIMSQGRLFIAKKKIQHWSKSLQSFAFQGEDSIRMDYDIVANYEKGANITILMANQEKIYVNAGFSAANGGYLHSPENSQGVIARRSAAENYHLAADGIAFFEGAGPVIISQKIRSELLSYNAAFRSQAVGAYLKGKYYLCIPDESVMYEFDSGNKRFIKFTGILDVATGDDGVVYLLKADGIYSFATDQTKRRVFSMRTPEISLPDDLQSKNLVIDCDLGSVGATIEYYLNGTAKTSVVKTTNGRERITIPITQEAGARISARISTDSETNYLSMAVYSVWLQ